MDQPAFLGVTASLTGRRWIGPTALEDRLSEAIAQETRLPLALCQTLAKRDVLPADAKAYLAPSLRDLLPDPLSLRDMDLAARRFLAALEARERIAVFGDYDVDGGASSALLLIWLRAMGHDATLYIPDRIDEGYGPNEPAMAALAATHDLILCVDCGTLSHAPISAAKGADVIILDHHLGAETLPAALAIVNPNRQDEDGSLAHLCAASVVFLMLVEANRQLRSQGQSGPDLMALLDLVALATVADVAPLIGVNRAFVRQGLKVMARRERAGLVALADVARMDTAPTTYALGFVLGPRINAGGRIGDAGLGARLLVCEDTHEADAIAMKLEDLNRERQAQEAVMLQQALAQAEAEIGGGEGPCVLITESANWHPGIVGLIAARLKERFRRPAFAIHFNEAGRGTGSGRSVSGIDIGRAVREAVEKGILVKGGGHVMAAGLTVERANLAALRAYFEETLASSWRTLTENHVLKIDGALTARGANLALVELLERAGPFGSGHPSPVFAFPAHTVRDARIVGTDHVSVRLSAGDGAMLQGIAFRAAGTDLGKLLLGAPQPLHVAGTLGAELFRGQRRIQLRILDAAPPPAFV